MTSLTDRYVSAAVRSLPEAQRSDVDRELRASIADDVDARVEAGASPEDAERAVLTELGDPAGLAARYADRPLYLIGPTNFLFYRRFLLTIIAIVTPIAAVGSGAAHALAGETVGPVIAAAVVTALSAAMHIAFWVTLVFAILDWTGASRSGPLVRWTLDMLPELPERRARLSDAVASLVFLVLVFAFIVYQQFLPVAWAAQPVSEPVLDPALWSFWLPFLLVVIAAEGVFAVVIYRTGRWTWPLAVVNALLALAAAVPITVLALTGGLYNPAFLAAFDWASVPGVGWSIAISTAVAALGTAAWDIVDGIVKTIRSRRGAHRSS